MLSILVDPASGINARWAVLYHLNSPTIAFSPDKTRLARLWAFSLDVVNVTTNQVEFEVNGVDIYFDSIDWAPDNNRVVACSATMVLVFDVTLQQKVWETEVREMSGSHVQWSPGGDSIALCRSGMSVLFFNPENGKYLSEKSVSRMWWSPDGKHQASVAWLGDLKVNNAEVKLYASIRDIAWSPCGELVAVQVNDELQVRRISDLSLVSHVKSSRTWGAGFAPNGKQVLFCGQRWGDVMIHSVSTGELLRRVHPAEEQARLRIQTMLGALRSPGTKCGRFVARDGDGAIMSRVLGMLIA